MDKHYKIFAVYVALIITLIITIWGSVFLNEFLTPFSMGDQYTPWETDKLKSVLAPDSYKLSGPMLSNYAGNSNKPNIDDRDNRYIAPITFSARLICLLFRWRVRFASLASLIGIILFIMYKIRLKKKKHPFWIKSFLVSLHACFFMTAFYGTMCVRWWGYG